MATPFVAGSVRTGATCQSPGHLTDVDSEQAALYWSIKGRKAISALALRDVFATTSVPVANQTGTILESVVHQGALLFASCLQMMLQSVLNVLL